MNWTDRYVGIRFASQGRTLAGCDCWGLVRLIYQTELGITLPEYGEISATDLVEVSKNISSGYVSEPWTAVDTATEFDVAVMRFHGSRNVGHVGVMVDSEHVVHTEKGIDASVVPMNHMTIRHRLVCFRRHKEVSRKNE